MSALVSPSFGSLLRHYRLVARLTQEQLAERAGLSPRAVLALERGERRRPYRQTLELLASALRLSPQETEMLGRAAGYAASSPTAATEPPTTGATPAVLPLVGRSRELTSLERFLTSPDPPVLMLAGEPGIGKSRLMQEVARQAVARGYAVLPGGAQRRSGQEPYAPLLDTLSRSLGGLSKSRLRSALTGCRWLTRLLPELLDIVDAPMPVGTVLAVHERRLIYAAVYRYLTNIAGPAGTVLILDDLQWSSPDGLDLLASVIQRTDGTAVRVIGAYRSTTVRQDHPLSTLLADLAEQCLVDQLDLDPLGDEDAMRLLDALLQSSEHADDHAVKQRIVQRAGGVPFFLLSYVHAIEERGRWPSVPWTAAQSIRQRLAALPPAAQEIVRAAAILGRVSRRSTLLEMVESAEAGTGLDAAAQARLLLPHGNSTYQFAHDVVRESVEADLGEAHRVLLHRKAAQILEKLPEPERIKRSAELAWHFQEGDEPLRALPYSIQAGDESAAVSAHAEAQRHYRTALEALRRLGLDDVSARRMEAAVLEKLSALLAVTPNADETRDLLHRAAGIYRALGDPENEGRIIAQMGRAYYWGVGTTPERKRAGITFLQAAMESLGEDAPARTRAALSAVQSHLLFSLGMYRECLDAARAASELARCGDDDGVLAEVEVTRGAAFIKLGQEEEGFNATREALHLAEKAGDQFSEVRALYGLAALSFRRGCFSECRVHGPRALEVAERTGHTWAAHALLRNLGVLEFVTGDWPRARRFYERAIDLMRSFDESWRGATALPPLAWLELSAGNGPAVFHYLEESRLRAERTGSQADSVLAGWVLAEADLLTGDPSLAVTRLEPLYDTLRGEESSVTFLAPFPVPLLPTLAEAHLMAGNEERAEELVDASIRRCRARGHRPELVEALRVRGSLLARRRLWLEAERAFAEGLSPVRAMACPYAEARLLGAEGQMGLERGELELGRVQLQKALALFRRLGARPDAERIEHLLASPLGLA